LIRGNPPAQNPLYPRGGQQQQQQQRNNQGGKGGGKGESDKLLKTVNTLVKEIQKQQSINAAVVQPAPAPAALPAPQGNSQGTAQVPNVRAPRG